MEETEIEKLKKDIENIMALLNVKEKEMKDLEKKLNMMEDQISKFACNHCDSSDFNSATAIKPMENSHQIEEEKNSICYFAGCMYKARTITILRRHMTMKHKLDSNFVFPSSNEKVKCDECDKEFFLDNNYALHTYNEHQTGFNCGHCHQNIPGGDDMGDIHYNLCTFPCDDHPFCPCKL